MQAVMALMDFEVCRETEFEALGAVPAWVHVRGVHFENVSSKIKLPEGHKHGTITTISKQVLKRLMEKK